MPKEAEEYLCVCVVFNKIVGAMLIRFLRLSLFIQYLGSQEGLCQSFSMALFPGRGWRGVVYLNLANLREIGYEKSAGRYAHSALGHSRLGVWGVGRGNEEQLARFSPQDGIYGAISEER